MILLKVLLCLWVSTFHVLALTPDVQDYIRPSDDENLEPNPDIGTGIFPMNPNNNNERSFWDRNNGTTYVDNDEGNDGGDAGGD